MTFPPETELIVDAGVFCVLSKVAVPNLTAPLQIQKIIPLVGIPSILSYNCFIIVLFETK
jgi:hypothetical protein